MARTVGSGSSGPSADPASVTHHRPHRGSHHFLYSTAADPAALAELLDDDGVGLGPSNRRSGLANMCRRAERHGGTLILTAREPTGTRLTWSIPTIDATTSGAPHRGSWTGNFDPVLESLSRTQP